MTHAELDTFFPFKLGCPLHLGASSYAVPTLKWLQGPFWDFFYARYWSANLNKWQIRWECRDFASAYRITAIECWARSLGVNSPDDGLSVGEIWFRPKPDQPLEPGHAICPVICDQGLLYIDPQNNTLWPMSDAQFDSRFYLRF